MCVHSGSGRGVGTSRRFLEAAAPLSGEPLRPERPPRAPLGDNGWMDSDGLVLIGPTVVLRVPGEADVGPLWDAVVETMGELRQWMSWFHDGYSETDVRIWVESTRRGFDADDDFNFVITERGEGTVLGACGLNKVDHANRLANLGYWVRTTATGNGTATESAALVAHWALGELGLNRLEVVAATSNGRVFAWPRSSEPCAKAWPEIASGWAAPSTTPWSSRSSVLIWGCLWRSPARVEMKGFPPPCERGRPSGRAIPTLADDPLTGSFGTSVTRLEHSA